jgi:hypothetical protein
MLEFAKMVISEYHTLMVKMALDLLATILSG